MSALTIFSLALALSLASSRAAASDTANARGSSVGASSEASVRASLGGSSDASVEASVSARITVAGRASLSGGSSSQPTSPPRGASLPSETLLRELIAETAVKQLTRMDPAWHPEQRDCAGLIRFAYRSAFNRLEPTRVEQGLWSDREGSALHFADAETLVRHSFLLLGRDERTLRELRSGDLLAFRQEGDGAQPDFHLMMVVGEGASARVVYHPGEKGAAVRTGSLRALLHEPPLEWRPVAQNSAFLGFLRFKEWSR